MDRSISRNTGSLAALACLLEATAPKVGNVSRLSPQHHTSLVDYCRSSVLMGEHIGLMLASDEPKLGEAFRNYCKQMMIISSGGNTHVGTATLMFPLAYAVADLRAKKGDLNDVDEVQEHINNMLTPYLKELGPSTTIEFAEGIRSVKPAGVVGVEDGGIDLHDDSILEAIRQENTNIHDWMAAGRSVNMVADEFVNGFSRSVDSAKALGMVYKIIGQRPEMIESNNMSAEELAVVQTHLALLASEHDTLVLGKNGETTANWLIMRAAQVVHMGGIFQPNFTSVLERLDTECRIRCVNPGATADILGAGIFLALVTGLMDPRPIGSYTESCENEHEKKEEA